MTEINMDSGNLYMKTIGHEVYKQLLKPINFGLDINKKNLTVDMPEKYIINKGATILIWKNGDKTVVKRCEDDEFNKRLGFLTAFFQRYCGMSKNKANKFLNSLEVEDEIVPKKRNKTTEFKVGDKVKRIVNGFEIPVGTIGTISEIRRSDNTLKLKEYPDTCYLIQCYFELVNKQPKHMKEENNG